MFSFGDMIASLIRENQREREENIINELYPNPDEMTYEQLLELQDKIGFVSKGISKEEKEVKNNFFNYQKIPFKIYNKKNSGLYKSTNCTFCLNDFEDKEKLKKLKCEHMFHYECLDNWLDNEKTCPVCKEEVI